MRSIQFIAFGQTHDVSVEENDLGKMYEVSDAMAQANKWLWEQEGFKTGGHQGAWIETGVENFANAHQFKWVLGNFYN